MVVVQPVQQVQKKLECYVYNTLIDSLDISDKIYSTPEDYIAVYP